MQTVYRVYEGTREPHRLAVERTAEVLGRGGLALIPTETVYGVAVAVNAFSDAVPQDTSESLLWPRDPQAAVNGAAVPALGTGSAASLLSSSASSRKLWLGWLMVPRPSTATAWISPKRLACLPDDAGQAP